MKEFEVTFEREVLEQATVIVEAENMRGAQLKAALMSREELSGQWESVDLPEHRAMIISPIEETR